jgi:hypothetical protein
VGHPGIDILTPSIHSAIAPYATEPFAPHSNGRRIVEVDFIADLSPKKEAIHAEWENGRDREKVSRSRFAQHTLSPEAAASELQNVRAAIRPQRGRRPLFSRRDACSKGVAAD